MNKFVDYSVRAISFAFLVTMGTIFIGRLIGEWEGDPLVPLLMLVVVSLNAAVYQLVFATFGGVISVNNKLEQPPVSLAEQIERQASQN